MSRIKQVIETLEAERADAQERLAWLEKQLNEFRARHDGEPAAVAPARSTRRATAKRASRRRATARARQGNIADQIVAYLEKHPQSTAGDVAKGLNLNRNTTATRLSQMAKAGEIRKGQPRLRRALSRASELAHGGEWRPRVAEMRDGRGPRWAVALAASVVACTAPVTDASAAPIAAPGATLDLYSSLPLRFPAFSDGPGIVRGARVALSEANGRAGDFAITYRSLDDSTFSAGNWDPGATQKNARQAANDPLTIGYIGEYNSGASAISIPILNQAGIAQVSPSNTYVGLTRREPGSFDGEPGTFYPTGVRTYARIVPRDTVQAAALVKLMRVENCRRVGLADDRDTYGDSVARLFVRSARVARLGITSHARLAHRARSYRAYARRLRRQRIDCFLFAGVTANGAVRLYKDIHRANPRARLYGADGVCESGFTNPRLGGVPASVARRFACTVAAIPPAAYPGGRNFVALYKSRYGHPPPGFYEIFGYEAMKLLLDTIASLGPNGSDRAAVVAALHTTRNRQSVLGTYSINRYGDTTLTTYGVYRVRHRRPVFARAVDAAPYVP